MFSWGQPARAERRPEAASLLVESPKGDNLIATAGSFTTRENERGFKWPDARLVMKKARDVPIRREHVVRGAANGNAVHDDTTFTIPVAPSISTMAPSFTVASKPGMFTMVGKPSSRATMAECDSGDPRSTSNPLTDG